MTTLLDPAWATARGRAGTPAPVCSLTLLSATGQGEALLLVVRDPNANLTHPAVVSVPTQRVPAELFAALLGRAGGMFVDSASTGHDPVIYAVESIMARKLGLAEALERDEVAFDARVVAVTQGEATYANLPVELQREPIDMLNIAVRLREGPGAIPESTASYEHLFWSDVDSFLLACERRDPLVLLPSAQPYELCIHGLCIAAARAFFMER